MTPSTPESALLKLAERCEAAAGADRELDHLIAGAIVGATAEWQEYSKGWAFHRDGKWVSVGGIKAYTASIDAAMSLVPEHCCALVADYKGKANPAFWQGKHQYAQGWASVADLGDPPGDPGMPTYRSHAATPALALTAACLRAKAALLLRARAGSGKVFNNVGDES